MQIFRLAVIFAAVITVVFVCTSACAPASSLAQKVAKNAAQKVDEDHVSYIFASPHTTSRVSSEEARANLKAFDELNAISIADRIICSFAHPAGISGTLGIFKEKPKIP